MTYFWFIIFVFQFFSSAGICHRLLSMTNHAVFDNVKLEPAFNQSRRTICVRQGELSSMGLDPPFQVSLRLVPFFSSPFVEFIDRSSSGFPLKQSQFLDVSSAVHSEFRFALLLTLTVPLSFGKFSSQIHILRPKCNSKLSVWAKLENTLIRSKAAAKFKSNFGFLYQTLGKRHHSD